MAKQFEANEDWIKRENGRIPTKGAAASERASAGLGVLNDEAALLERGIAPPAALDSRPAEEPQAPSATSS
jgi:hypothetical protein